MIARGRAGLPLSAAQLMGLDRGASRARPIYLYGDSLLCRSTRNLFPTAGVLNVAAKTVTGFTPSIFSPPSRRIRFGGFADPRLNCVGTVRISGGAVVVDLPPDVDYTGLNATLASNAQEDSQAVFADEADWPTNYGLVTHASMYAGKQYLFENLAVGGSTPQNLWNRFDLNFAGRPAGVVLLEHSVNVGKNGISAATARTLYRQMSARLLELGHVVIFTTPTTFTSAYSGYAAANADLLRNAADARALAMELGITVIDLCELALDKTSTDGQPQAAFMESDGLHWTPALCFAARQIVAAALDAAGAKSIPAPKLLSLWDAKYTAAGAANNAASSNVLTNGQLFGSAASLPTGWTATPSSGPAPTSVAYTKSASDLGADGTLQVDYSGPSGSNISLSSPSFHADISAGKTLCFGGDMVLPADLPSGRIVAGVLMTIDGSASRQLSISAFAPAVIKAGTYRLFSKPWVVPAGLGITDARAFIQIIPGAGGFTNALAQFRQFRVDVL